MHFIKSATIQLVFMAVLTNAGAAMAGPESGRAAGGQGFTVPQGTRQDTDGWNSGRSSAAAPPYLTCPCDPLIDRFVRESGLGWEMNTSDTGDSFTVFSRLFLTDSIAYLRWWGFQVEWNPVLERLDACIEGAATFDIGFHPDNAGEPDTATCTRNGVSVTRTDTGFDYNPFAGGTWRLYEYDATITPCQLLSGGWLSIRGSDANPACRFGWIGSELDLPPPPRTTIREGSSYSPQTWATALCLSDVASPSQCPEPLNNLCASAEPICAGLELEGDVGICDGGALPNGPACNLLDGVCFDDSECVPWTGVTYGCNATTDNRSATTDGPSGSGFCSGTSLDDFERDIWYEVVAPCSGEMVINMCGDSSYDGMLGVFGDDTATPLCPGGDNSTSLACNDDFCGQASTSGLEMTVVKDAKYLIRVGGWSPSNTEAYAREGQSKLDIGFLCNSLSRLHVGGAQAGASNTGTSWADAYLNLQDALDAAAASAGATEEIWVAAGTYKPAERLGVNSGLNTDTFELVNGLKIYGGFDGTENVLEQRDIAANKTVLTGDLLGDDTGPLTDISRDENSEHVVTGTSTDLTAVLNGVTVTGGNSSTDGGGIYLPSAGATIRNCSIRENQSTVFGGGIYVTTGETLIEDCTFADNAAGFQGGAVSGNSSPITIDGCDFTTNTATISGGAVHLIEGPTTVRILRSSFVANSSENNGGAMNLADNTAIVLNCSIRLNTATFNGGGILFTGSGGTADVTNCEFINNAATGGSGGAVADNSNVLATTYTNCSITGNTAAVNGGGIWNETGVSGTLANSVVWNNSDAGGTDESAQIHDTDSPSTVTFSCIQDTDPDDVSIPFGGASNNNIDDHPLFANALGSDLRLTALSPCIDAADNAAVPSDSEDIDDDGSTAEPLPFDLGGLPRFIEDRPTVDTGAGASPVVDMGAHEFSRDCDGNGKADDEDMTECGGQAWCSDCNGNDILDFCDIRDCAGSSPDCDDCTLNGVPDFCDINVPPILEVDTTPADGIPDSCVNNGGNSGAYTSIDWGLGAGNYPDNVDSIPDLFVTVQDASVTLDADVEIPALRVNSATLNVTAGNLTVIDIGGISVDGQLLARGGANAAVSQGPTASTLFVGGDDRIDSTRLDATGGADVLVEGAAVIALSGELALRAQSQYMAAAGAPDVAAAMSARDVVVFTGGCVRLSDTMVFEVDNDLTITGPPKGSFGISARAVRGAITPPPCFRTTGTPTLIVRNDIVLEDVVDVDFGETAARGAIATVLNLGGSLVNRSRTPCLVDTELLQITFDGAELQTFEAGSQDFGPTPDAYAKSTDCSAIWVGRTLIDKSFSVGTIEVLGGREVAFRDDFDNDDRGQAEPEAVYVHTLILRAGSIVSIDRARLYYDTLIDEGAIISFPRAGVLQAVEFAETPATAPSPHDHRKNRFVSFDPNNDLPVMLRFQLLDLACSATGKKCSLETDCKACTAGANADLGCSIGSDCPGGTCVVSGETCDEQSPPVQLGWVGDPVEAGDSAPASTFVSLVVNAQPAARVWTESVVHLMGCHIAPRETYGISATTDGVLFSAPLVVGTIVKPLDKQWADLVGNFNGVVWSAPNGLVGVDDVNAMLKFILLKPAPHITVLDLAGSAPRYVNFRINATDLGLVIKGFKGETFPPLADILAGYPADGDVTQCPPQ